MCSSVLQPYFNNLIHWNTHFQVDFKNSFLFYVSLVSLRYRFTEEEDRQERRKKEDTFPSSASVTWSVNHSELTWLHSPIPPQTRLSFSQDQLHLRHILSHHTIICTALRTAHLLWPLLSVSTVIRSAHSSFIGQSRLAGPYLRRFLVQPSAQSRIRQLRIM